MTASPPRAGAAPLRFALVCGGERLPAWQAACIEQLLALPGVELAAVLAPLERGVEAPFGAALRPGADRAFRLWQRGPGRARALAPAPAPRAMAALPALRCAVSRAPDGREQWGGEALERLAPELDFILDLADAIPHAAAREPRHGIWCFRDGDALELRSGPPAFWELCGGAPVATRALVRLAGPGRARVLRQGSWSARRHAYARGADTLLFGGARWPAQVAAQILRGAADVAQVAALASPVRGLAPPGAGALLAMLARGALARSAELARQLFRHEQWNVGVVRAPIASFLAAPRARPIEWLGGLSRGEFRADPFGVVRGGELVILCEALRYRDGVGAIASLRPDGPSRGAASAVALGPAVHRSYPFLLELEGKIYCVPETHEAREVGLYEAQDFPATWRKVATLLDGVAAVDGTPFQHGGLWWLACTTREGDDRSELHLWYAAALRGPWQPHPGNPVKIDVRSARPAGTPFVHEGVLYRPAQDCSRSYGGRVVINRVTCLTPHAFAEEPAAVVEPDPRGPYPHGLHTLSAVGEWTLLDGKRLVFRPAEFARAVRRIARALLG